MKKILCLVLCLAMLLAFVGCGEGSATKGTEGLEYTLLDDGTYAVSVGTATDATEIVIPSKYEGKAVTKISRGAFAYCENITNITIPNSVTIIDDNAFAFCTGLTSITIPNGVTKIYTYTFNACSNLTSVTIPKSVSRIEIGAFFACDKLNEVTFKGTKDEFMGITNHNYSKTTVTIHCTDGNVSVCLY